MTENSPGSVERCSAINNLADRTSSDTALTASTDDGLLTAPDLIESTSPDTASAGAGDGAAPSVVPGTGATLDGNYQDVLGSAFEETGFSSSDFAGSDLYGAAGLTYSALDAVGDFDAASTAVNNLYLISRAVAGLVAASAVSVSVSVPVYCPIYTDLALS